MNWRRDRRAIGIVLTLLGVLLGGGWFATMEPHPSAGPVAAIPEAETRHRFDAAVLLLHGKQYEPAAAMLKRVLELAPRLPEAHANMGFALLGLQRADDARGFFEGALALNAQQANAYYGLALAQEARGDTELAIGAMRSYLHLARNEDEAHLRRARAAVWEWESELAQRRGQARR